jgi:hypothetical protein
LNYSSNEPAGIKIVAAKTWQHEIYNADNMPIVALTVSYCLQYLSSISADYGKAINMPSSVIYP